MKANLPILYIIATPIGNLRDITLRALDILGEVDYILCEDTRVTKKLLVQYRIEKPLVSYHQHSTEKKVSKILELFGNDKKIALASDAGTPGISDPGNELVARLLARIPDLQIVPIPGPSALTTLASVAGIPMDTFLFVGFPPHKRKRARFFERVVRSDAPVILYESKHRILKTLSQLEEMYRSYAIQNVYVVAGRELTKMFETIYRGTLQDVIKQIGKDTIKGEFTIIVYYAK